MRKINEKSVGVDLTAIVVCIAVSLPILCGPLVLSKLSVRSVALSLSSSSPHYLASEFLPWTKATGPVYLCLATNTK